MPIPRLPFLGAVIAALLVCLPAGHARGQIVLVSTPLGNIFMQMRPGDAPISVENFLKYINDGDYADSFFHRSARVGDSGVEVIQAGGFTIDPAGVIDLVPTDPPILNEPGVSNLRSTVAMARSSGVNGATSQWYINMDDINQVLDTNNEGFTVFADVVQGMGVADAIHGLDRANLGGALNTIPILPIAQPPTLEPHEVILTSYQVVLPGDTDLDGDIDDADLGTLFANFTGPVPNSGKIFEQGDTDFDGDVDDADLGSAFAGFTGPPSSPASVPEPASASLLALAGLALMRRRR